MNPANTNVRILITNPRTYYKTERNSQMSWYGYQKKEKKHRDPNLSTDAQRKYVRAIAEALSIKIERKLMKKDYCEQFINEHKLDFYKYMNENGIVPPPTQKQKKFIEKMKNVLCHYYKDSEVYTDVSDIEKAKKYIAKWKQIYFTLVANYKATKYDPSDPWG